MRAGLVGALLLAASLPGICLSGGQAAAQTATETPPATLDFGDAALSLLGGGSGADPYQALKQIPLNDARSWTLTFGGEVRERFETSHNPVFGLEEPPENNYLLHRLLLSADLRIGQTFRGFVQFVNALAPGWTGPQPPTQEDQFDLLQAYGEINLPAGDGDAMLRLGRQEMAFGSSRLISVRESPNVHRAFDGARGAWILSDDARVDVILVRPVTPEIGVFNDSSNLDQALWGVYGTLPIEAVPGLNMDLYYLGYNRQNAVFASGSGVENRQSFGLRLFGEAGGFDWDFEGVYQFGSFSGAAINAWTASLDAGYTFASLPMTPRLGLNADAISGDRDLGDNRLGTFNALYPKLPYFSEANLVAPSNLLDLQPSITVWPVPALSVRVAWNPLWKETKADAFYVPPLVPLDGSADSDGRFVGHQSILQVDWQVTTKLKLAGSYVHYEPGSVARQAGGVAGDFGAVWAQLKF